jgi:hypothetical protein
VTQNFIANHQRNEQRVDTIFVQLLAKIQQQGLMGWSPSTLLPLERNPIIAAMLSRHTIINARTVVTINMRVRWMFIIEMGIAKITQSKTS